LKPDSSLLLSLSVICLVALALLARHLPCWCLSPLLKGLGALSQALVAAKSHHLAHDMVRCSWLSLCTKEGTPLLLTALALKKRIHVSAQGWFEVAGEADEGPQAPPYPPTSILIAECEH